MTWLIIVYAIALIFAIPAWIVFGCVSSSIAKKKGFSAGLFWFFGFACGVAALIVSLVIPNKNKSTEATE